MEKINIDELFPSEEKYEGYKRSYIADYQVYVPGGFFSMGYYKNAPAVALAKWKQKYPNGYTDWREKEGIVAYSDLKTIGDKINEVIDSISPNQEN